MDTDLSGNKQPRDAYDKTIEYLNKCRDFLRKVSPFIHLLNLGISTMITYQLSEQKESYSYRDSCEQKDYSRELSDITSGVDDVSSKVKAMDLTIDMIRKDVSYLPTSCP